jgi:hypothetical protein
MKLCLIGSSRFKDLYEETNRRLTLAGHVVYSIAVVSTGGAMLEGDKETLDLVHLRKMQESEGVVVVTDETGYVGPSTRRELKWAAMLGLPVQWIMDRETYPNLGVEFVVMQRDIIRHLSQKE